MAAEETGRSHPLAGLQGQGRRDRHRDVPRGL